MALPQQGGRGRVKSGRVKENFEASEVVSRFEAIRDYLLSSSKERGLDYGHVRSSDLARLCGDLQTFMEDNFGVTAKQQGRDWLMTRLPARCFRSFRVHGPLYTIMRAAYDHKAAFQWRSFNLGPSKRDESITLFFAIEKALREEKFLCWPRLFFDASVPERRAQRLGKKAEVHGAQVVARKEDATHIVVHDLEIDGDRAEDDDEEDDGGEDAEEGGAGGGDDDDNGSVGVSVDTCRVLKVKAEKGQCLVHWWYYPDSYDEWISTGDVDGPDPDNITPSNPPKDPQPPFTVGCRFVRDVDRFNEWGNELDYEASGGRRAAGSSSGKKGGSSWSVQVKVRAPSTPTQNKKSSGSHTGRTTGGGGGDNNSKVTGGGSAVKVKVRPSGGLEQSPHKSSSGSRPKDGNQQKRSSSNKHSSGGSPGSSVTSGSHKDSEVDSIAGSSMSGNSSVGDGGGGRKRAGSEDPHDDDEAGMPTAKKARNQQGERGTEPPSRREAELGGSRMRVRPSDEEQQQSNKRGRGGSAKESAAAQELKKLKAKRLAGIPELNAVVEASGDDGKVVSGPSVPPSQEAEREDVQLLDIRTGHMRSIRATGGDGDGDDMSGSEGEDEEGDDITTTNNRATSSNTSAGGVGLNSSKARKLAAAGLGAKAGMRAKDFGGRHAREQQRQDEALQLPVLEGSWPDKTEVEHVAPPREARALPHVASELNEWFDAKAIHPMERRCMPEFFNGTSAFKTPEVYQSYRTYMMEQYKVSPKEYLSYTDCRRRLAGDAGAILRVHEFLDHWGLINDQVPEEGKPPSAALRLCGVPVPQHHAAMAKGALVKSNNSHNKKDHSSKPKGSTGGWSAEEVKALKEAVIDLKEDWEGIAQRVGGKKGPAECLVKFLSLPLASSTSQHHHDSGLPGLLSAKDLVKHVHPQVVKAAADAAWKEVLRLREAAPGEASSSSLHRRAGGYGGVDDDATPMEVEGEEGARENGGEAPPPLASAGVKLAEWEEDLSRASSAGLLSVVGLQARALAEKEESEVGRLLQDLLEIRIKRMELKVEQLEEAEKLLGAERAALQAEREDLFLRKAHSAAGATTL